MEGVPVRVAHVVGLVPAELLVKVNVRRGPVAHGKGHQGDVDVHQADVGAKPGRELFPRKRLVRRHDGRLRHVPCRTETGHCGMGIEGNVECK